MSRGRTANRLYLVNAHDDDRDLAVAHADERRPPPLDAATKALARTAAQTSATDATLAARVSTAPTPALEARIEQLTRDDAADQRRARRDKALADRAARHGDQPTPAASPREVTSDPTSERALIAEELAHRQARARAARAADPPHYLLQALGPPPDTLVAHRRWHAQADQIEQLRRTTGFDDPDRPLPDRADPKHRAELDRLRRDLATASQELDAPEQARGIER